MGAWVEFVSWQVSSQVSTSILKKNMLPLFFKVSQKDNGHGAANAAGFGWRNGG
jgi:hypothetical protein